MLSQTSYSDIDSIRINFDTDALWMLNIALAIIMFGVSLDITLNDFKRLLSSPKIVFVGILSQFIILPLFTYVLVIVLKPHPSFALGMMLIAACPGGNVSNFFSKMANGNAALSVSLTAFATLICIFLTPLNLQIWGRLYEPTEHILKEVSLNPFDLTKLVVLILGIPLIIGMFVRYHHKEMADKINTFIKPFSVIFFLVLIVIALYENAHIFKNYIHLVLFLVIFHNLFAYFLGYSVSKLFKLSKKDTKTISIETGIQNGGLGLLLIFSFFNGLGGMALLAAFWGVWDIFSGMMLATYWGRKK
ncbi:bile acid:Na+ symporter, BASS family [Tenacibaculum sp. MAR_2009_124]|uniref:bile acid:sodium symporter family protein n=1 Tax=Tenacibaculum sp. MAR_2009_124 TaxID=1250059 RepID=UPI00089A3986|nr:bile acid:sodium symporter family protein [Tenacibaculum sp. MAR_2009_124]SEC89597.1 bile acid:Na+ symporter, BASS family [Tenacibaculum sp. MAR_2009_124]